MMNVYRNTQAYSEPSEVTFLLKLCTVLGSGNNKSANLMARHWKGQGKDFFPPSPSVDSQ